MNLKGGVAKSVTAKNFGYILAKDYGKRVLLIDMDPSGSLSASFGARPDPYDSNFDGMSSVMDGDLDVDPRDHIVHTHQERLDIIPSNNTLIKVEEKLRASNIPQHLQLASQLEKIWDDYDYAIIDTSPSESIMSINILTAAEEVTIPSMVDLDSFDAILRVRKLVSKMARFNPKLNVPGACHILFTIVEKNTSVDREGMTMDLQTPKYTTYIRKTSETKKSRYAFSAIKEFNPKCTAAIDYDNFVAEYLGNKPVHPSVPYVGASCRF